MRLRDLTHSQIDALQRRCLNEWQELKKTVPDENHLIPFKVYEKIWSAGARAILERVDKWPTMFKTPPSAEWVEKHKDDSEPEVVGAP